MKNSCKFLDQKLLQMYNVMEGRNSLPQRRLWNTRTRRPWTPGDNRMELTAVCRRQAMIVQMLARTRERSPMSPMEIHDRSYTKQPMHAGTRGLLLLLFLILYYLNLLIFLRSLRLVGYRFFISSARKCLRRCLRHLLPAGAGSGHLTPDGAPPARLR